MAIYVIGHKNPDTDATIAPIIYSYILKEKFNISATPILQGKPNKETYFVFKHFNIPMPEIITNFDAQDKFYIVDTTNPEELPDNIQDHEILGIVDHHKLAGLKTSKPLFVFIEPLGSSVTVLLNLYEKLGGDINQMPTHIQQLALASIISDTLNLTSPITTEKDKQYVAILSQILNINHNELANQMFEAKSDVSDLSGLDIITYDAKAYTFNNILVQVAVFETVKPQAVLSKYDEIYKALREFRKQNGFKHTLLFVIDIINQNAYYIRYCKRSDALIKKSFDVIEQTDTYYKIPGIVSRKKQIVPVLEKALQA